MPVAVDMIERQPGCPIGFELRGDFSFDLPLHGRIEGDLRAIKRQVVAEISCVVDQAGYLAGRTERRAIGENNMQPDAQVRQPARPLDRIRGCGPANHEACRAQDAALVRFLNGGVDRFAEAEVVRRDYQPVQCASSRRSRRKEKNSTPSRSRRIIICGLRTISPMIEAIFGARK